MITRFIDSRHATLEDASHAAALDLSYNLPEAQRHMQDIQSRPEFKGAIVSEGIVFYTYEDPLHGKMLNKFDPFMGCISNTPLHLAIIDDKISIIDDIKIDKRDHKLRKSLASRSIYLIDSVDAVQ